MYFDAIRENKILAKISEFTVYTQSDLGDTFWGIIYILYLVYVVRSVVLAFSILSLPRAAIGWSVVSDCGIS